MDLALGKACGATFLLAAALTIAAAASDAAYQVAAMATRWMR